MTTRSILLLPPKPLASCIAAAIYRDTREANLSDLDRFNYFPATPLVTLTFVVCGELRLVPMEAGLQAAMQTRALPEVSLLQPQDLPTKSWSPGPVQAMTIGFYPDAWRKLEACAFGQQASEVLRRFIKADEPEENWRTICEALLPTWNECRNRGDFPDWPGSDRLSDWSRYVFTRVAMTSAGRSLRTAERRIRHWTGGSRQQINYFAALEDLHRRRVEHPETPLAGLANEAGFSDQSHMNRVVRRGTGFSPAKLNRLIQTEEAFWCYRLLEERF